MAWMHPHSSRLGGWHVVSCPGAPGLPAVWRRWPGLHPHGSDVLASWRSWPSKLCRTSSIMSCSSASACVCVCLAGTPPGSCAPGCTPFGQGQGPLVLGHAWLGVVHVRARATCPVRRPVPYGFCARHSKCTPSNPIACAAFSTVRAHVCVHVSAPALNPQHRNS